MKKIYSLIIVLITLSLIGLVFIQVSWIQNAIILRQEQIEQNIQNAVTEVGKELADQKGSQFSLGSPKLAQDWPTDQLFQLIRPPSISQKYSAAEVTDRIRRAFQSNGLKDTKFEFAIINHSNLRNIYEMQSPNFGQLLSDTIRNRAFGIALSPVSGSISEGLVADEELYIVVPSVKNFVLRSLGWLIIGATLFTLIIIAAFFLTVRTMLRQKKLSEIKSDFINNMTHEFKTPLATISLAVDALKNEKVVQDREKMNYFSNIIKDENKRMNVQVETILQAALLDKQEVQLNMIPKHVHDIIDNVLVNFRLQLEEKKARVDLALNAKKDLVEADEIHFTNLLNNLVDNAIKYSKDEGLLLNISTQNVGKNIRIRIEDNGIGMNKETLTRVFEKFYRAHTGNIHNVKGFGLGLSYVKAMVEAHKGKIKAESTPGRGTSFTLEFPTL